MGIDSRHFTDENGNPDGAHTHGRGFTIAWQRGGLVGANGERHEPNGAFVEDVIAAARDRLEYYQTTKFSSDFNAEAILYLELALSSLRNRSGVRRARGIEGTHEV